jgi:outer membrane murein-binding lipoprotein Lpp
MNREAIKNIQRLEAKVSQLEEAFHDLSQFISEMDINFKESNRELSRQVNIAIREINAEIAKLSQKGEA